MVEISISDISKRPSILDNLEDIAKIVNKKSDEVKGLFIPFEESEVFRKLIEEIQYRQWLKRNSGLLKTEYPDFLESVVDDIGKLV